MEDPKERLTKCISTAELERRWKAVREMMRVRKIDYLVMQNSEEFLGGILRWFTDFPARHQFPMTVIFPVDDEMTTINCGGDPPADQYPPAWAVRGIKKQAGCLLFPYDPIHQHDGGRTDRRRLEKKEKSNCGLSGTSIYSHNLL